MRLFGGDRMDRIKDMMDRAGIGDDVPINAKILSGAIENAQKTVESRNFQVRKNVLEYDDVMNTQRKVIYEEREQVLEGADLQKNVQTRLESMVESHVVTALEGADYVADQEQLDGLVRRFEGLYFPKGAYRPEDLSQLTREQVTQDILALCRKTYEDKVAEYGEAAMREVERVLTLRVVDEYWMDHIDAMHDLRQGITLRAYGQTDPVVAYKREGYEMFDQMIAAIREETIRRLFLVRIKSEEEIKREKVAKVTFEGGGDKTVKRRPVTKKAKVGRNDPCPCGSGKKYKNCCLDKDLNA